MGPSILNPAGGPYSDPLLVIGANKEQGTISHEVAIFANETARKSAVQPSATLQLLAGSYLYSAIITVAVGGKLKIQGSNEQTAAQTLIHRHSDRPEHQTHF